MTGSPSFTFRDRPDNPECTECSTEMTFLEQREDTFHERDVYGCSECGTTFEDRWTF